MNRSTAPQAFVVDRGEQVHTVEAAKALAERSQTIAAPLEDEDDLEDFAAVEDESEGEEDRDAGSGSRTRKRRRRPAPAPAPAPARRPQWRRPRTRPRTQRSEHGHEHIPITEFGRRIRTARR